MSQDSHFKSMSELIKALEEGIGQMEDGQLDLEELSGLTDQARDLYERLVVIRHRAYDEIAKADHGAEEIPSIRITVPENQMNLIDAIESEGIEEEGVVEEEEVQSFEEEVLEEEQEVFEEGVVKEVEIAASTELPFEEVPVKAVKAEKVYGKIEIDEEAPKGPPSLADKLGRTPVGDLRKAIALNQKFQFITSLFKGDQQSYDKFIEALNTAEDSKKAVAALESFRKSKELDEEDRLFGQLKDLVERRYL